MCVRAGFRNQSGCAKSMNRCAPISRRLLAHESDLQFPSILMCADPQPALWYWAVDFR